MKELYIAELERLAAEYEDAGMSPDAAYTKAGERAYDSMRERLLDKVDQLRKREKGE